MLAIALVRGGEFSTGDMGIIAPAVTIASSMLRQGASLQDIAGVLRHRSTATTEIYAKVDVVALRQIAQPWPEVKSC
jgi:hypothetical protein